MRPPRRRLPLDDEQPIITASERELREVRR